MAKVSLIIHGVPYGEDVWGNDGDSFYKEFYSNSDGNTKLFIQVRNRNGEKLCYYSYLVYKSIESTDPNIVDYDSRPGGYFGMTIRTDMYIRDTRLIYNCLENLYQFHIYGNILKADKGKLRYCVTKFEEASAILNTAKGELNNLLRNIFNCKDAYTDLSNFATSDNRSVKINRCDCTISLVENTLKKGAVSVSEHHESVREKNNKQQFENQLSNQQDALSEKDRTIKKLNDDISAKNNDNISLSNKVSQLEQQLGKSAKQKKVSQLIDPIKEPLTKIADYLETEYSHTTATTETHNKQPSGNNSILDNQSIKNRIIQNIPIINLFLILVILLLLIIHPNRNTEKSNAINTKSQYRIAQLEKENASLKNENVQLKKQIEAIHQPSQGINTDIRIKSPNNKPVFQQDTPQKPTPRIDIANYNGKDPLEIGKSYSIRIKNFQGKGEWNVSGGKLLKANTTQPQIEPETTTVTISFTDENGNVTQRTINAK